MIARFEKSAFWVLCVIFGINALTLVFFRTLDAKTRYSLKLAKKSYVVQKDLYEKTKTIQAMEKDNKEILADLNKARDITRDMTSLILYIQRANARMLKLNAGIDRMETSVAKSAPDLLKIVTELQKNVDESINVVKATAGSADEAIEKEETLLKITKKRSGMLKKIPDKGLFF